MNSYVIFMSGGSLTSYMKDFLNPGSLKFNRLYSWAFSDISTFQNNSGPFIFTIKIKTEQLSLHKSNIYADS